MASFLALPRATRANFNALRSASGLVPYSNYYITDEGRFEFATAVNASTPFGPADNTVYSSAWNGVSTIAPTKDAVYDEIEKNKLVAVVFHINGGGAVIASGQTVDLPSLPFAGTIQRWTITANASGSAVVTISKATYANFPTMTAISGTEKPTLSSAQKNEDTSLTTWTTSLAQGDVLRASVDSASTITSLTITLWVQRT